MDLSVVIPTYNQADLLRESLRSLIAQTLPKEAYEIVVVDDGSTDHTAAVLQEFGPAVRVVRLPVNRGRSSARNEGIRAAGADLIAFVDSDIIVKPDFLALHLQTHRQQGPGILSRGPVIDVRDVTTALNGIVPRVVSSPAYLTTANSTVEKAALIQAGLFDETFPGYGWEDFELGIRLRRQGIRRVFCRQAVAFHVDPQDTLHDIAALLQKEEARAASALHFYRKHQTAEVRLLIQATSLHRVLYWIQSGCGLLTPRNVTAVSARLRRAGRLQLAAVALRGVLNRHYLRALYRQMRAAA